MRNKIFFLLCAMGVAGLSHAGSVSGKVTYLGELSAAKTIEFAVDGAYAGSSPLCHTDKSIPRRFVVDLSGDVGGSTLTGLRAARQSGDMVRVLTAGDCLGGLEKAGLIIFN